MKKILGIIAKSILDILRSIGMFIKNVAIKFGSIIKSVSLFIWNIFLSHIINFLLKISKLIYRLIKYIFKNILNLIRTSSLFFWNYLFSHIYKLFKIITVWIYKNIIYYIFRFIQSIVIFLLDVLMFIWEKILIKIFTFIKNIFTRLFSGVKYVSKQFKNAIKFIFRGISRVFKILLEMIRLIIKSTPEFIYNSILILIINIVLIIHFIIFILIKFIIYEIPKFILIKLYKVIKHISNIIKYLFEKIKLLLCFLTDYIQYYYIILSLPLVIPVFIVMYMLAFIVMTYEFLIITVKSLLNKKIIERNENIYIKPLYNPNFLLIKNFIYTSNNLKYDYILASKKESFWLLFKIIVFKTLFLIIFIPLFEVLLLPITLIGFIFRRKLEIENRIVLTNKELTGIVKFNNYKDIKLEVSANTIIDRDINSLIIDSLNNESITIKILNKDKTIKEYKLNIKYSKEYLLLKELCIIKRSLVNQKSFIIDLPSSSNKDFNVSYEKNWLRDKLLSEKLIVRNHKNKTSIKVIIKDSNMNVLIESDIKLENLINPSKLTKLVQEKSVIKVKSNDYVSRKIDKKYHLIFKESENITSKGQVISPDNHIFETEVSIKGFEHIKYRILIESIVDPKRISYYIEYLKENLVDYNLKTINFKNIKLHDNTYKEVDWYINHIHINDTNDKDQLITDFFNNKRSTIETIFNFNGKYYKKVLAVNNTTKTKRVFLDNNNFELSNNDIKNVDSISINASLTKSISSKNTFINFPKIQMKKVMFTRWKSINIKEIKSSGKIINSQKNEFNFELIVYYNLFKKRKISIKLIANNN